MLSHAEKELRPRGGPADTRLELKSIFRGDEGASPENMAIRGDNLPALIALSDHFSGRFRCIYLDPPFNTGRTFDEYSDARSPESWRAMMARDCAR